VKNTRKLVNRQLDTNRNLTCQSIKKVSTKRDNASSWRS